MLHILRTFILSLLLLLLLLQSKKKCFFSSMCRFDGLAEDDHGKLEMKFKIETITQTMECHQCNMQIVYTFLFDANSYFNRYLSCEEREWGEVWVGKKENRIIVISTNSCDHRQRICNSKYVWIVLV